MFYFSYDGFRKQMSDYGCYRPSIKNTKEGMSIAVCLLVEDSIPTGIYKIATAGTDSLKIPFDVNSILGNEVVPDQKFELTVQPESIKFKE